MLNIKQDSSPYFSNRGNWKITGIVIHTTVGNFEGTLNWFRKNDKRVSANYVVREDGAEITQMVDESKASHHAGIISNPVSPVYRGDNPNFYTIGIENADGGNPHTHIRDGQYRVLAELVRDICRRNSIPLDRHHICGHRELYDKKTCPGNLDVDKIVALAKQEDEQKNMEITDQTKIPQILSPEGNPMEVQAIKGELYDRRRDAKAKDDEIKDLQERLASAEDRAGDTAKANAMLVEDKAKLQLREQELEENLRVARSERDTFSWKADRFDLLEKEVEILQEENNRLRELGIKGLTRWQLFLLFLKGGDKSGKKN